jgi:predicted O-methyltransferase YrrM
MKKIFILVRDILEPFFAIIVLPGALLLKVYRDIGSSRLPLTTKLLKKLGVFVIKNHYYEPMFTYGGDYEKSVRPKPEVFAFDLEAQKIFLQNLNFSSELESFHFFETPKSSTDFYMPNNSFDSGDAEFLYSLVRYQKPNKVIEIGSGHSSKLVSKALEMNASESDKSSDHILVEPYPKEWLERLNGAQLIRSKIEYANLDWSAELESGDLLFIDSSHMIRPGGDVLMEYLEILPKLASGVIVHIHDIFTPRDYLSRWREKDVLFWNEQYLVEAILANSSRYTVLAGLNYLKHECFSELKRVCPYLDESREPGSLYIVVN